MTFGLRGVRVSEEKCFHRAYDGKSCQQKQQDDEKDDKEKNLEHSQVCIYILKTQIYRIISNYENVRKNSILSSFGFRYYFK